MLKVLDRKSLYFQTKGNTINLILPEKFLKHNTPNTQGTFGSGANALYTRVYLRKAVIPCDFKNINDTNNKFTWNSVEYTLQNEDPNIYELIQEFAGLGIEIQYDTKRSYISVISEGELDLRGSTSCNEILGLEKKLYSTPLTSLEPVQLKYTENIFIHSNIALNSSYEYRQQEFVPTGKILQLPINVSRYTNLIYEDDSGHASKELIDPLVNYSSIYFSLRDDRGDPINIQNEWSCEVILETIEDRFPLQQNILKEIGDTMEQSRNLQKLILLGNII